MSTSNGSPHPRRGARPSSELVDLVWTRLPGAVPARWPVVRAALDDGRYLQAWPRAALAVPIGALVAGFVGGWRPWQDQALFGPDITYTGSLVLLLAFAALGGCGAGLGVWGTVGFIVGDLVLRDHLPRYSSQPFVVDLLVTYVPLVLAYALLAVFAVLVPLIGVRLGRASARRVRAVGWTQTPAVIVAIVGASVCAVLVWSWTHTVPTLLRPLYTWPGGTPPTEAVQPVQDWAWLIVLTAAASVAGRVVLEQSARTGSATVGPGHRPAWFGEPGLARSRGMSPRPDTLGAGPAPSRFPTATAVRRTAMTTFLMSGLFTEYWHAVAFAVLFGGAQVLRWRLADAPRWSAVVSRVPLLARLAVAVVASYLMGAVVVDRFWAVGGDTFLPVLVSVTGGLLLFSALVVPSSAEGLPARRRRPTAPQ